MANKAKLLIIADEKGIRAEIEGTPSDVMCLVKEALEKGNACIAEASLHKQKRMPMI